MLIGTLENRLKFQLETEGLPEEKEFCLLLKHLDNQQTLLNKKLERQRAQACVCTHVGG